MTISRFGTDVISIVKELPSVEVYLVGGPSGAGKTVLANGFSKARPVKVISLDDYFLNEDKVRFSLSARYGRGRQWDHPSSVDLPLALRNTIQLLNHNYTKLPIFSFAENKRMGYRSFRRRSKTPILIEGLHALRLQSHLRALLHSTYSIFVNAAVQVRRERISIRDEQTRGRPLKEFDRRFHFMRIAEVKWILPQCQEADLILDTTKGVFRIVEPHAISLY